MGYLLREPSPSQGDLYFTSLSLRPYRGGLNPFMVPPLSCHASCTRGQSNNTITRTILILFCWNRCAGQNLLPCHSDHTVSMVTGSWLTGGGVLACCHTQVSAEPQPEENGDDDNDAVAATDATPAESTVNILAVSDGGESGG